MVINNHHHFHQYAMKRPTEMYVTTIERHVRGKLRSVTAGGVRQIYILTGPDCVLKGSGIEMF